MTFLIFIAVVLIMALAFGCTMFIDRLDQRNPILIPAVLLLDAVLAIVFAVLVTHVVSIYNWL